MPNTGSLKQRLREAESPLELGALMMEGSEYNYASKHTRRQWVRISQEKVREFNREFLDAKKKSNK